MHVLNLYLLYHLAFIQGLSGYATEKGSYMWRINKIRAYVFLGDIPFDTPVYNVTACACYPFSQAPTLRNTNIEVVQPYKACYFLLREKR